MTRTADVPRPLRRNWFHILLALSRGARHGYAVMKDVEEHTHGQLRLWPATLYGTLSDLVEAGLIRETEDPYPDDGRERRAYRLSAAGQRVLAEETERLAELVTLAREVQGS